VQVAGNWMGMVQSRVALLEQAIARAVGGSRQLVLESHGGAAPMAATPAPSTPAPNPTPVPAPAITSSEAQLPPRPVAAPPTPTSAPAPKPESNPPPAQRQEPSVLDDKAKRLADFFNGQVLNVDLET
jgi:DNA polymerase-3 subunit gamma/tau